MARSGNVDGLFNPRTGDIVFSNGGRLQWVGGRWPPPGWLHRHGRHTCGQRGEAEGGNLKVVSELIFR